MFLSHTAAWLPNPGPVAYACTWQQQAKVTMRKDHMTHDTPALVWKLAGVLAACCFSLL